MISWTKFRDNDIFIDDYAFIAKSRFLDKIRNGFCNHSVITHVHKEGVYHSDKIHVKVLSVCLDVCNLDNSRLRIGNSWFAYKQLYRVLEDFYNVKILKKVMCFAV